MSAMNLLLAIGWPRAGTPEPSTLGTHVIVAGASLAFWLLLMVCASRLQRAGAQRSPDDADDALVDLLSRNVLPFRSPRRTAR